MVSRGEGGALDGDQATKALVCKVCRTSLGQRNQRTKLSSCIMLLLSGWKRNRCCHEKIEWLNLLARFQQYCSDLACNRNGHFYSFYNGWHFSPLWLRSLEGFNVIDRTLLICWSCDWFRGSDGCISVEGSVVFIVVDKVVSFSILFCMPSFLLSMCLEMSAIIGNALAALIMVPVSGGGVSVGGKLKLAVTCLPDEIRSKLTSCLLLCTLIWMVSKKERN